MWNLLCGPKTNPGYNSITTGADALRYFTYKENVINIRWQ